MAHLAMAPAKRGIEEQPGLVLAWSRCIKADFNSSNWPQQPASQAGPLKSKRPTFLVLPLVHVPNLGQRRTNSMYGKWLGLLVFIILKSHSRNRNCLPNLQPHIISFNQVAMVENPIWDAARQATAGLAFPAASWPSLDLKPFEAGDAMVRVESKLLLFFLAPFQLCSALCNPYP